VIDAVPFPPVPAADPDAIESVALPGLKVRDVWHAGSDMPLRDRSPRDPARRVARDESEQTTQATIAFPLGHESSHP